MLDALNLNEYCWELNLALPQMNRGIVNVVAYMANPSLAFCFILKALSCLCPEGIEVSQTPGFGEQKAVIGQFNLHDFFILYNSLDVIVHSSL